MNFSTRLHWLCRIVCLQTKVNQVFTAPAFVPFDVQHYHGYDYLASTSHIPNLPIGDPLELEFIEHMKTRPLAKRDFVHTHHRQWRMLDDDDTNDDNEATDDKEDKGVDVDDGDDYDDSIDPLTLAGLFEGDIVVYTKQELRNLVNGRRAHMRSALSPPEMLWPDSVVPYIVADTFSDYERRQIGKSMEAFHELTCIQFVPRGQEHADYLIIYQGKGCSSGVGRRGGPQSLSLASRCIKKNYGTILHELMHALGFEHEQARYDRDLHVTINWDNIDENKRYNFGMRPSGPTTTLGLAYDYNSLMHYGPKFFAVNRSIDTIVPDAPEAEIGNRIDFSELDLKGINTLYNCEMPPESKEQEKDHESSKESKNTSKDQTASAKKEDDENKSEKESEEKISTSKKKRKHKNTTENNSKLKRRRKSRKENKKHSNSGDDQHYN